MQGKLLQGKYASGWGSLHCVDMAVSVLVIIISLSMVSLSRSLSLQLKLIYKALSSLADPVPASSSQLASKARAQCAAFLRKEGLHHKGNFSPAEPETLLTHFPLPNHRHFCKLHKTL